MDIFLIIIIVIPLLCFIYENLHAVLMMAFFISLMLVGIGATSFWMPLILLILVLVYLNSSDYGLSPCACCGDCPHCAEPKHY